jgi:ubiquinone/menaquinone biosynthesis C-methylase UbiE
VRSVFDESFILIRRLPPSRARILDLGGGASSQLFGVTEQFPQGELVGVDTSREAIAALHTDAKKRGLHNTRFFQVEPTNPLAQFGEDFDGVHRFALDHYKDSAALLHLIHRALDYTGKAFVIEHSGRPAKLITPPSPSLAQPDSIPFPHWG